MTRPGRERGAPGLVEVARQLREGRVSAVGLDEDFELMLAAHRVITFVECAAWHHHRFEQYAAEYGPKARELIEPGLVTPAVAYVQAQRLRKRFPARIEPALRSVDAVLAPAAPGPAPRDLSSTGQPVLNIPWTVCGLPVLSVPSGLSSEGLPLGIQLVAAPQAESRLLAAGAWCQAVLGRATASD